MLCTFSTISPTIILSCNNFAQEDSAYRRFPVRWYGINLSQYWQLNLMINHIYLSPVMFVSYPSCPSHVMSISQCQSLLCLSVTCYVYQSPVMFICHLLCQSVTCYINQSPVVNQSPVMSCQSVTRNVMSISHP